MTVRSWSLEDAIGASHSCQALIQQSGYQMGKIDVIQDYGIRLPVSGGSMLSNERLRRF